ncbi:unnamed protein product [Auanema sp. JU1783]|nr:unnamed protein product [Auanema sp. JU1783]
MLSNGSRDCTFLHKFLFDNFSSDFRHRFKFEECCSAMVLIYIFNNDELTTLHFKVVHIPFEFGRRIRVNFRFELRQCWFSWNSIRAASPNYPFGCSACSNDLSTTTSSSVVIKYCFERRCRIVRMVIIYQFPIALRSTSDCHG